MTPDEWQQALENEAASVEDAQWASETRRYLHIRRVFSGAPPLLAICLSVATFPAILAMTYGNFIQPWPTLMGLCAAWLSLASARHVAHTPLGRAGLSVMGAVGLAFAITVAIPLEGTAALLWLLGFPVAALLACLGARPPYRAPLGLLTLPLGVWLLVNFTSLAPRETWDTLTDTALLVAQVGWMWLSLLRRQMPAVR